MAIFNLEMVTFLTCSSAKTHSPVFAWALLMGETMTSRSNLDQDHTVFDDLWCSGRFTHPKLYTTDQLQKLSNHNSIVVKN